MKTPRITNYTIRKTDFGFRALLQDELGYWWYCNFYALPSERMIIESWSHNFSAWRKWDHDV